MKHAPKKRSKTLLIFTVLAIVIIVGTICYFIGKASNNKHEEISNSSSSASFSSRVSSSNDTSNSSQLSSSNQLNKDQESKQSTPTSSSQTSSQTNTSNQNLVYYNGQSQITLPTTDGTIQPQQGYPDGATFWPSTLTINGQKENVIASYSRQGYFAIYTKEPTSKPQGFTYNGVDFVNHFGDKDLDPLASSSKTIRY